MLSRMQKIRLCQTAHGRPSTDCEKETTSHRLVLKTGGRSLQLTALDAATKPSDLGAPGWRLHPLTGELKGFHSITVNGNWRVIFRFVGQDVELVDYLDYH